MSRATLMLLADGRFPAGGHAHSSGTEAACAVHAVHDIASLRHFLLGRLHTSGRVDAAFAAVAAAEQPPNWQSLDAELDSRVVSPRLRGVSRTLGRQLLRAGDRVWPSAILRELRAASPFDGPHQAIALGAVARAAGLPPIDAAACTLHHLASTVTTAALRLLGLDPFDIYALLAETAPLIDALAAEATVVATEAALVSTEPGSLLPALSGPLTEILAEDHATWEVRLFAS
jgi:urease accessory protein